MREHRIRLRAAALRNGIAAIAILAAAAAAMTLLESEPEPHLAATDMQVAPATVAAPASPAPR